MTWVLRGCGNTGLDIAGQIENGRLGTKQQMGLGRDGLDTRHCSTSNIFHFLWKITGLVFCFKVLFLDLAHCVIVCLPRNKHDYRDDFTGRDLQRWRRLTSRRQLGIRSIPLIMMLMLIMMMVMIMAILIMLTFICIITYIINLKTILLLSTDTNRFYWFPKFFNLSVYSVVTSYRDTKWITEGPFIYQDYFVGHYESLYSPFLHPNLHFDGISEGCYRPPHPTKGHRCCGYSHGNSSGHRAIQKKVPRQCTIQFSSVSGALRFETQVADLRGGTDFHSDPRKLSGPWDLRGWSLTYLTDPNNHIWHIRTYPDVSSESETQISGDTMLEYQWSVSLDHN